MPVFYVFSKLEQILMCGWLGFNSRQGQDIFLLSTAFVPALVPTQHPIQWLPGAKRLGHEAYHPLPSSAVVGIDGAVSSLPHTSCRGA
jgi:hypothetical protein